MASLSLRSGGLRLSRLYRTNIRPALASIIGNREFSSQPEQGAIDGKGYLMGSEKSTMRAAVLWEPKKPMVVEDLRMPRPKTGEVLIKTKACGVCHSDLHVIKADQPYPSPVVLGHEITGEVVEHGPHTDAATLKRVPVGARVVGAFIMPCGGCFFCVKGEEDLCETFFKYNRGMGGLYDGSTRLYQASTGRPIFMYSMGGLAEYCVVPTHAVAPLAPSLPYTESAIIGCAVFTAYGAMKNAADMRAGETVAVIGTGGVGSSCVQVARAFGGRQIIAVDVSEKALTNAKKMGATHTVNASSENVVDRIREITGGRGVDVAVEALGKAPTFVQAIQAVREGGKAVMVGLAPAGVTAQVDIAKLVRRKVQIIGSYGGRARQDLPTIITLAEMGFLKIESAVTQKCSLEEADATYAAMDRGEITGRAVVDIDPSLGSA
ncbi:hypothetical protein R1flu_020043 [Riccia fluitans]|uniref:Enoyl reductase (ER) domain-containing protein n=1 Tax=Riccia fluitans TaxID=41844 RepID=A0ABD1ZKD3_9MARC